MKITSAQFDRWVAEAIEMVPQRLASRFGRLVFVVDDRPTLALVKESELRRGYALFGYYRGHEQTGRKKRVSTPDKIYIFRWAFLEQYKTLRTIKKQVMKTVWHEISHHFGSDEEEAEKVEKDMFEKYILKKRKAFRLKREIKKAARVGKGRRSYKRKSRMIFRVEKV